MKNAFDETDETIITFVIAAFFPRNKSVLTFCRAVFLVQPLTIDDLKGANVYVTIEKKSSRH